MCFCHLNLTRDYCWLKLKNKPWSRLFYLCRKFTLKKTECILWAVHFLWKQICILKRHTACNKCQWRRHPWTSKPDPGGYLARHILTLRSTDRWQSCWQKGAYLHIIKHLESCFWQPDECKSNIHPPFCSVLVSTNPWGNVFLFSCEMLHYFTS